MNTGTIPSKIISTFTHYNYSHVVLSLDDKYQKLYSFGRKEVHNFLNAGLVTDGINSDFFKTFNETMCKVYKLDIDNKKYNCLRKILKEYEKNMNLYKYDLKGLIVRFFYQNSETTRENYYVCTQFVAEVLEKSGIFKFPKASCLIRPEDFNDIPGIINIFEGKFLDLTIN